MRDGIIYWWRREFDRVGSVGGTTGMGETFVRLLFHGTFGVEFVLGGVGDWGENFGSDQGWAASFFHVLRGVRSWCFGLFDRKVFENRRGNTFRCVPSRGGRPFDGDGVGYQQGLDRTSSAWSSRRSIRRRNWQLPRRARRLRREIYSRRLKTLKSERTEEETTCPTSPTRNPHPPSTGRFPPS